jgi:hypothetical protein
MLVILARALSPFGLTKPPDALAIIDLDHYQRVTVIDYVACGDNDLGDRAGNVGEDGDLHLHRLQDHHGVVSRHLLAHLDRDEFGDDGMAHAAIVGFTGGPFR